MQFAYFRNICSNTRVNFAEPPKGELRRIALPRTRVNKDKEKDCVWLFPMLSRWDLFRWEAFESRITHRAIPGLRASSPVPAERLRRSQ
jgi:hypothetical protein